MSRKWIWCLVFGGVVLFPFVFAQVAHHIASLSPGSVKVDHWRHASSGACLAAIVAAIVLLYKARFNAGARVALGGLVGLFLLFAAFTFQLRSRCGDEPVYIGTKVNSSCE